MESITKQLVNIGHGMSKEIAADEPAVAKLLVELSSSLDVQYERGNALEARCAALAAENEAIKFYLRNGPVIRKGGELAAAHQFAPETPATDAFLAEVRASALEYYANLFKDTVNMDVKHNQEFHKGTIYVADQFRKGAAQ